MTRDGVIVACVPLGLTASADKARHAIVKGYASSALLVRDEHETRELIQGIVDHSGLRRELTWYSPQVSAAIDLIYTNVLYAGRPASFLDGVGATLRARGLLAVLPKARLLRASALLGLASSLDSTAAFCDETLKRNGFSLTEATESLQEAYEAYGYPDPPLSTNGLVFATV